MYLSPWHGHKRTHPHLLVYTQLTRPHVDDVIHDSRHPGLGITRKQCAAMIDQYSMVVDKMVAFVTPTRPPTTTPQQPRFCCWSRSTNVLNLDSTTPARSATDSQCAQLLFSHTPHPISPNPHHRWHRASRFPKCTFVGRRFTWHAANTWQLEWMHCGQSS